MTRSLLVTKQQVEFFKDGIAFTASWNKTWWVLNSFFHGLRTVLGWLDFPQKWYDEREEATHRNHPT